MAKHRSMEELKAGLPGIKASPSDNGGIEAIVVRPDKGRRLDVRSRKISLAGGVDGDHWSKGCWKSLADGSPDPDVQICMMNARCIKLIAGSRDNWPPAGDNLFIDMDLSPDNLASGQVLSIGSATVEITDIPHTGCRKFIDRYGRDACVFVNTGEGKRLNLRGVYARVVKDGTISVGDRVKKIG